MRCCLSASVSAWLIGFCPPLESKDQLFVSAAMVLERLYCCKNSTTTGGHKTTAAKVAKLTKQSCSQRGGRLYHSSGCVAPLRIAQTGGSPGREPRWRARFAWRRSDTATMPQLSVANSIKARMFIAASPFIGDSPRAFREGG